MKRQQRIKSCINCFKCRHFYITWDKKFRYGCRAMGFKSYEMPSDEVLNASRVECLRFYPTGKNDQPKS
ncbi:MAG: uracil-DNA glycosylase [Nitrospirae bacterium]|nr:uracil-DNA glycosylase [Nitrospirota bacterium]